MKDQSLMVMWILAVVVLTSPAAAQTYEVRWHTVDGGGIMYATGNGYKVGGTIGQPDAGRLVGGEYAVIGGFWVFAGAAVAPPPPEAPDPDVQKNRYISMVIPTEGAGQETAIRVRLTSLHHPGTPTNPPDFGNWEGEYRWVNAVDTNPTGGLHTCDDSLALHTTFKCAKLGCTPEYRDWAGELNGAALHVTGAAVVPSSTYDAAQLAASCEGNEATCTAVSEELSILTTLFGNVDNDPQLNVLDVAAVVDKVKDLPSAFIKPRTQLQPDVPDPTANVNVLDAATAVDALKGKAYGYFGDFGPCTDACPGEVACP